MAPACGGQGVAVETAMAPLARRLDKAVFFDPATHARIA